MSPKELIDRTRLQIEAVKRQAILNRMPPAERGELMGLCLLAEELIESLTNPDSHPSEANGEQS